MRYIGAHENICVGSSYYRVYLIVCSLVIVDKLVHPLVQVVIFGCFEFINKFVFACGKIWIVFIDMNSKVQVLYCCNEKD